MNYKVSIIVPIYNSEQYIERAVTSLFEQDFESIEYIFVDDCSSDESLGVLSQIISKYPKRQQHVKIIKHEANKGSGAARKTGLKSCTGEFTIQIDSDDWCELNMISSLYTKAESTDSDVVVCDYYEEFSDKSAYTKGNCSTNKETNIKNILQGVMHSSLCNKFIRRNVYEKHNIYPPEEISFGEDYWVCLRLFSLLKENEIVYLEKAFLHYDLDVPNSLSKVVDNKNWSEIRWAVASNRTFLEDHGLFSTFYKPFLSCNLIFILNRVVDVFDYKEKVKYVCPELDRLKHLWLNDSIKINHKIIYSFYILNNQSLVNVLTKLKEIAKCMKAKIKS